MSASANTLETLNGNFKKVYTSKGLNKIIPSSVKILPEIEFIPSEKMGGLNYNVPVVLANEHGVTYGGDEGEAFTLDAPVAGQIKEASVKGNEIVLRSFLSYGAASRAEKSEAAFVRSTKHLVENMVESITKKLEAETLYGQMGLAKVDSVASNTFTVTTAEFAPGIWTGSENMRLDFYSAGGSKRGSASVTSVDLDARTVTVDTMPAGVVATDEVYEKGAYGKEFAGIHKILSNTGSLFGISAATYNLWKSTSFPVGGNLSYDKINQGIAKAAGKGLDEDIRLYVSPATWSRLATDQAAFRSYDQSYKSSEAEQGFESVKFYSQNGSVEVIPHTYIKEGYAFGLVLDEFEKVGSTDVTFKIPGKGEDFFRPLENAAGYELRCYADWAIFCHKPNKQILFTGIDNTAS
jgi:hypothetical protein